MLSVFSGEIYKLLKGKYFWAGLTLVSGIIALVCLIMWLAMPSMPELADIAPKNSKDIIGFIYPECGISFVISFMSCLLVSNEIRMRTINNMIPVCKREILYFTKLFTGFVITFVTIFAVLVTTLLVGAIYLRDLGFLGSDFLFYAKFLFMQSIISFATCSISIALAFMVKNIVAAIPVCVLFEFVAAGVFDGLGFFNESFNNIGKYVPAQMVKTFTLPEELILQNFIPAAAVCAVIIVSTSAMGILRFKNTDF
jgi:hypothetical protein